MSKRVTASVLLATGLLVVVAAWFAMNLSVMHWRTDPVVVSEMILQKYRPDVSPGLTWVQHAEAGRFPGVRVVLETESDAEKIRISLASFLGLGWQEMVFESQPLSVSSK
ncbi:MAG TPA: hypothetical protein PKA41_17120 [Verrucomicrobiota bacterium]|nr:hypothetical protein [Verrucomicrobiota bacterium]